jgi:hypothetical protein
VARPSDSIIKKLPKSAIALAKQVYTYKKVEQGYYNLQEKPFSVYKHKILSRYLTKELLLLLLLLLLYLTPIS